MSRLVNATAEVEILMPVRVKVNLLIRADEDAKIGTVIKKWSKRKTISDADIEDEIIQNISSVDGNDIENEIVENIIANGGNLKMKLIDYDVTDSR